MYLDYETVTFQKIADAGNAYDIFLVKCRQNIFHYFFTRFSLFHCVRNLHFTCIKWLFFSFFTFFHYFSLSRLRWQIAKIWKNINDPTHFFVFWAGGPYISRNASECAKVLLKTLKQHQYMLSKRLRKEMRAFKRLRPCKNMQQHNSLGHFSHSRQWKSIRKAFWPVKHTQTLLLATFHPFDHANTQPHCDLQCVSPSTKQQNTNATLFTTSDALDFAKHTQCCYLRDASPYAMQQNTKHN